MTSSTSAPSPSPAGKAAAEPALTAKPPKKRPAPSDAGDASGEDDTSLASALRFFSSPRLWLKSSLSMNGFSSPKPR